MQLEIVKGDITLQDTDAVVNAANSDLTGGSGVNGAVHQAAGPELPRHLKTLGGCQTGDAVITPGYNMKCRFIVHAVGPIWHDGSLGEDLMLQRCYRSCMRIARDHQLQSIAFPAISTGIYGYPKHLAIPIAVKVVRESETIPLVRFVAFDDQTFELFQRELSA